MTHPKPHPSSYRDPSGYIFVYQNEIYRQVNKSFQKAFEAFVGSGLYDSLVAENLLIPHQVIEKNYTGDASWFTTVKPERVGLISYPYEWSFSMLKDAALLTLQLALKALDRGMILKDASPFNVQFYKGRMVFIDSLSFEEYKEGEPWIAYRQFCENFIGPLALMHYTGLPMQQLLLAHPAGIPLKYVKSLLHFRSKLNVHLYLHIHLHASYSFKRGGQQKKPTLSKQKLVNLLKSLQALVTSLQFDRFENIWGKYYKEAETRPGYLEEKKEIISGWLSSLQGIQTVIDVGGNEGEFSKLAAAFCERVICADGEHFAVEQLYKYVMKEGISNVIPLCIDFTNPSPAIGVNNEERSSFLERASSDLVMALALIHHLAIGKNIPFDLIAKMFAQLGNYLIIEFVPKTDDKVKLMLQQKADIYSEYSEENFQTVFAHFFSILHKKTIGNSGRTIYLMKKNA